MTSAGLHHAGKRPPGPPPPHHQTSLPWERLCVKDGRSAVKAEDVCREVFPGVRTGSNFPGGIGYIVPSHWGTLNLGGERGTDVPLLARAASAPWPRRRRRSSGRHGAISTGTEELRGLRCELSVPARPDLDIGPHVPWESCCGCAVLPCAQPRILTDHWARCIGAVHTDGGRIHPSPFLAFGAPGNSQSKESW